MWEITGAEFTNQGVHTADGISIRFPRVTRIRDDKDWSTATNLDELRVLFQRKPESVDFDRLLGTSADVKDVPRKKLPDAPASTSPSKIGSARAGRWNAPSTSSSVKEEPMDCEEEVERTSLAEGAVKRRKGDDGDDKSSGKVPSEPKRAKTKRETKGETKDFSSTRPEKDGRSDSGIKRQKEDRFDGETEGSVESSFDASVSDSDVENTVSYDYTVHCFFFLQQFEK